MKISDNTNQTKLNNTQPSNPNDTCNTSSRDTNNTSCNTSLRDTNDTSCNASLLSQNQDDNLCRNHSTNIDTSCNTSSRDTNDTSCNTTPLSTNYNSCNTPPRDPDGYPADLIKGNILNNKPLIDPKTTVSFTGYRLEKIRRSSTNPQIIFEIETELIKVIWELYDRGYRTFISGMAPGFDMIAAQTVIKLRDQLPGINLIAAIPYPKQSASYTPQLLDAYNECVRSAIHFVVLSDHYYDGCFHRRNDYLIENCTVLVCYYDGQPGGTKYTFNKGYKLGREIINIADMF